ncbi:MAG TPA: proline dehydrogenase family protein [Methylomirabilota bacterium]|nr:proline dehydrogenase family protein [Methylomirabilota bacterium]
MADDARIRSIGRELLDRVRSDGAGSAGLMEWALQEESLKLQLFRLVDVLPALYSDRDVARHVREYLAGDGQEPPAALRVAIGLGGAGWIGEKLLAAGVRHTIRRLARRFIAGGTPDEAIRAARRARRAGQAFTLDVLGEACLSEDEADRYQDAYLELIEKLGAEAARWPDSPALDHAAWGALPKVNISVKLSALYPYLDPIDPAGSGRAVKARMRPMLRAAQAHGAHIQVDMEERRLKDLMLDIFTALCDEDEFRATRNVGVVLQAYLRDSEADAERLVEWARRRGTPITVRLVKGAYWDYESAHARLEGWPVPVYQTKSETDASFERLTRFFLERAGAIDLAIGSHNIRSIAHALGWRERLALPRSALELQMLYGMAGPLAGALAERGERVRIYMPFGELIPGMAYLVRRLLENTSNESFLRRGFSRAVPAELLLDPPAAGPPRATNAGAATPPPVPNEPRADFALPAARQDLGHALTAVREQLGGRYPLVIGGAAAETAEQLVSLNPSRAAEVVGRVASASAEDVDRAVAAAESAFPGWRDRPVTERAAVLARAAQLMRERRAELAAWIVFEAGKPWREADADVAEAIDFIEYYRRQALELLRPLRLGDLRGEVNHYLREPCGVAAVIAPWNFPQAILTGMTSAALVTGNTVVLKPAEQTPVIAARVARLFEEAGLPAGVLNFVPGPGEVAGDRLVHHPGVRLIAFTGSRDVGTQIYASAAPLAKGARHLKRVIAEMGGKNAVIVDDDADLDEAVEGIIASAFGYAGQKCSACSRVIAVGRIHDRLAARLVAAARTIPIGPADLPSTIVGPVIEAGAADRIRGYVELGRQSAEPLLIRDVTPELAALGGYYAPLAIFGRVPTDSPLAQDEIFGPVLSVMRARDFDEAIAIATDVDYALTGGVFSRSPGHLRAARDRFRVGNLYLNRAITGALVGRQPFGGRQLSGVGYQAGGPDYLIQFVETRVVTEQTLRRGFASGELA